MKCPNCGLKYKAFRANSDGVEKSINDCGHTPGSEIIICVPCWLRYRAGEISKRREWNQIEYLRNKVGEMSTRAVNALVNEETFW